jgi:hypothetical protein
MVWSSHSVVQVMQGLLLTGGAGVLCYNKDDDTRMEISSAEGMSVRNTNDQTLHINPSCQREETAISSRNICVNHEGSDATFFLYAR